jgi:hypothetical protein
MSDEISPARLDELIEGWEQSRLALEIDAHDAEFNDNCKDTAAALRSYREARKLLAEAVTYLWHDHPCDWIADNDLPCSCGYTALLQRISAASPTSAATEGET